MESYFYWAKLYEAVKAIEEKVYNAFTRKRYVSRVQWHITLYCMRQHLKHSEWMMTIHQGQNALCSGPSLLQMACFTGLVHSLTT